MLATLLVPMQFPIAKQINCWLVSYYGFRKHTPAVCSSPYGAHVVSLLDLAASGGGGGGVLFSFRSFILFSVRVLCRLAPP